MYDVWGIALWINYSFFCLNAKERTKEKIKAAPTELLRPHLRLKGRNSLRSNSLPFFTPEIQPPLDAPSVRPGDRSDGKL